MKKKVNRIVIKETVFKKSSLKQPWNWKTAAVADRAELLGQQNAAPRSPPRTVQDNAGTEQVGQGRAEERKGKNGKSGCTRRRGSFFISFWNIGRKQKTTEATCKMYRVLPTPRGKTKGVSSPSPCSNPTWVKGLQEVFRLRKETWLLLIPAPPPQQPKPPDRDFPSYVITLEAFGNQKDDAIDAVTEREYNTVCVTKRQIFKEDISF